MSLPATTDSPHTERGCPITALTGAAVWLLPLALCWFAVPKFVERFTDFGVALPNVTRGVILFSRWFSGENAGQSLPGIVWVLPPLLGLVGLIVVGAMLGRPRGVIFARVMTGLGALLLCALLASLLIPYFSMTSQV